MDQVRPMSSQQGFATARFRLADLLLIQPHQVAAQRRPRTEERPRRQDQGSEGLTIQRPVTEEVTLPLAAKTMSAMDPVQPTLNMWPTCPWRRGANLLDARVCPMWLQKHDYGWRRSVQGQ